MADFVGKEPCPTCGSRDNLARYSDGSAHCFGGCGHYEHGDNKGSKVSEDVAAPKPFTPLPGHIQDIANRKLQQKTCDFWKYEVGEYQGKPCHIANYRNEQGRLIAQKVRTKGKDFLTLGNGKALPLYGQWLWNAGKHIVITEGEIDALSVSQAFGLKWPVVSLPNGAQSAEASLKRAFDWLSKFENIVLMFDMDKPGRDAVELAAQLLPIGKVKIASLPDKDANAVLLKYGPEAIVKSFWNAKSYSPAGIVSGAEMTVEGLKKAVEKGFELPWPKMNAMMLGLRKREITMLTAGTGIGKSTLARELAYHMHQKFGCKIGNVFLEEGNAKTAQAYIAIHNNVPLGRLRNNPDILPDELWQQGLDKVIHERMWFYNHFGSLESSDLLQKMRYLATVLKVDFIFLDHISIVVSGQESEHGERKDIDILMTRLRSLCEETGVGIVVISHLSQPDGTPHEEGGRVTLRHLRGSGSLKQLSDNVIALERDQQDAEARDHTLMRSLKIRETGETGEADQLCYDRDTGRLTLASPFEETADVL